MSADWDRIRESPHYVYRLIGGRGETIYIGCTYSLESMTRRNRDHAGMGHLWDHYVAEGPYPRKEARRRERELIEVEQPPWNLEYTPRSHRGKPAYKQPSRYTR